MIKNAGTLVGIIACGLGSGCFSTLQEHERAEVALVEAKKAQEPVAMVECSDDLLYLKAFFDERIFLKKNKGKVFFDFAVADRYLKARGFVADDEMVEVTAFPAQVYVFAHVIAYYPDHLCKYGQKIIADTQGITCGEYQKRVVRSFEEMDANTDRRIVPLELAERMRVQSMEDLKNVKECP